FGAACNSATTLAANPAGQGASCQCDETLTSRSAGPAALRNNGSKTHRALPVLAPAAARRPCLAYTCRHVLPDLLPCARCARQAACRSPACGPCRGGFASARAISNARTFLSPAVRLLFQRPSTV